MKGVSAVFQYFGSNRMCAHRATELLKGRTHILVRA